MSNFTPAERIEVDRQYRILVKALHELDPAHPRHLREALARAEQAPTDPTLARVLVAREVLRGVAWEGRSPLTVRDMTLPGELASALSDAEKLGRAIGRFAYPPRRGLLGMILKRKSFSQAGKEALMHCRAIGAAHERRQSARRPGRGLRQA
ncbi:hypothetical protein G7077_00650 [Sphingomonas piscis]|uniref:Uncharacterized protein n=1 Tax=Sphingomonas piscis TaxID=2714943 RepID=A0A6G7YLN0_9SPHN|nr:hypothetical protein [Sphingomonas piscis]QIK77649.1 hypothetical protein G7077_00650 [Sphingomonas piscis]